MESSYNSDEPKSSSNMDTEKESYSSSDFRSLSSEVQQDSSYHLSDNINDYDENDDQTVMIWQLTQQITDLQSINHQ